MGVILDLAPVVVVNGGAGTDLTEVNQRIEANKQSIGDLSLLETEEKNSLVEAINELKSGNIDLSRVEVIENYIINLEERLRRIDIQILD